MEIVEEEIKGESEWRKKRKREIYSTRKKRERRRKIKR